jgi:ABC-type transport system substrate-binding protein
METPDTARRIAPHVTRRMYQDFLSQTSSVVTMRTDMPPFNDVRVRRAISHAIDRGGINEEVWVRAAPTAAVSHGLVQWSLPIEQLGEGATYYRYDPKEARRLLAEAGYPKEFKTQLTVTNGLGRDRIDEAVLVQRYLKDVGIGAELKIQEHGAYTATTVQGKLYVAEQQYYVYLNSNTITTSWQPYVKNFAPNHSFDYGNRAAALRLDRQRD